VFQCRFGKYENICLAAGGIGITPCKAIFESLAVNKHTLPELKRVVLLWSCRDRLLFDLLQQEIAE
jgi:hypothetical protein